MEKKSAKGYSLVELMVVMAIIGILGTMLVTMMNIGGKLYRNSSAAMEEQSNARLAMSYITMRIRQNDVSDRIDAPDALVVPAVNNVTVDKVDEDDFIVQTTSYSALTIINSKDPTRTYWIYFDSVSNKLMEQNVSTGSTSTSSLGEAIADIDDYIIKKLDALDTSDPTNPKVLYRKIIIKVKPVNSTEYFSQEITLRSQYNNL